MKKKLYFEKKININLRFKKIEEKKILLVKRYCFFLCAKNYNRFINIFLNKIFYFSFF